MPEDLWQACLAAKTANRERVRALVLAGVTVVDPDRVTIAETVRVSPGAVLWPDVTLLGTTEVATGATICAGCWLDDTFVGPQATIRPHSVCEGARIGEGAQVGPMAHLRTGAVLERATKVGNFVEVKKSVLREGAKASHLTYIGDAEIGERANIGAGTITCNYDGFSKHRTIVGKDAFIGSNTSLVAPVVVGDGAITGAGSVISKDIPADALALERAPVKIFEGRAPWIRARNKARASS